MAIYAIGDIHGKLSLLRQLYHKIREDAAGREGPHTVVFLGDYIDRGEDSKGVLDFIMTKPFPGFKHVFIRGNHEDMMIETYHSQEIDTDTHGTQPAYNVWVLNGFLHTAKSFVPEDENLTNTEWAEKAHRTIIPYAEWLKDNTVPYYECGKYIFVHAGLDPLANKLEDTRPGVFTWVRYAFLNLSKSPIEGKFVIHGHTPVMDKSIVMGPDGKRVTDYQGKVELTDWRLNLDSGAFATELLSAARIEGDEIEIIQVNSKNQITFEETE